MWHTVIVSSSGTIKVSRLDTQQFPDFFTQPSGWEYEANVPSEWRSTSEFEFHRDRTGFELRIPHWLPVLIFIGFAGAPWISWPNRFSLRTLLVATTLV